MSSCCLSSAYRKAQRLQQRSRAARGGSNAQHCQELTTSYTFNSGVVEAAAMGIRAIHAAGEDHSLATVALQASQTFCSGASEAREGHAQGSTAACLQGWLGGGPAGLEQYHIPSRAAPFQFLGRAAAGPA